MTQLQEICDAAAACRSIPTTSRTWDNRPMQQWQMDLDKLHALLKLIPESAAPLAPVQEAAVTPSNTYTADSDEDDGGGDGMAAQAKPKRTYNKRK